MNVIQMNSTAFFDDAIEDKEERKQRMLDVLIKLFNYTMQNK